METKAEIINSILQEPFPDSMIKQREGAGRKTFDYIPAGNVIQRVIQATDNRFSWYVESSVYHPEREAQKKGRDGSEFTKVFPAFWCVTGTLTIEGLGSKSGVGTQVEENEDSVKGAETDAFKRAAVKHGVCLDLYIKDDNAGRDWAYEFADRCKRLGFTGSRSRLCGILVGKEKPTLSDYAAAVGKSAASWAGAISRVSVPDLEPATEEDRRLVEEARQHVAGGSK